MAPYAEESERFWREYDRQQLADITGVGKGDDEEDAPA
jgi:hypothetical protein